MALHNLFSLWIENKKTKSLEKGNNYINVHFATNRDQKGSTACYISTIDDGSISWKSTMHDMIAP